MHKLTIKTSISRREISRDKIASLCSTCTVFARNFASRNAKVKRVYTVKTVKLRKLRARVLPSQRSVSRRRFPAAGPACVSARLRGNNKGSKAQSYELRSNRCRVSSSPEHLMKYN